MSSKRMMMVDELAAAVTDAEIFCVKHIEKELKKAGIRQNTKEWNTITARGVELMVHHREEMRDMYRRNKGELQVWLNRMTGIVSMAAVRKMQQLGLTGDVAEDLKRLEVIR